MTEKVVSKVSGKKKAEAVIKVDGEGANGSEGMPAAAIKVDGKAATKADNKPEAVIKVDGKVANKADNKPATVVALAKELQIDVDQLLGWQVYPDRVVIVANNGMKFSSSTRK